MRRLLLVIAVASTAVSQTTQIDPSQLKRPIKVGTALPAACAVGDLFFKTDAPAGSNLYGCAATNVWSVQGGLAAQNCLVDTTTQLLKCQNNTGDTFTLVKVSASQIPNQWVDYVSSGGVAHTSQPSAAQVQNAVDQTANYSNPTWITSLAWSKLSGVPLSFNAGQLQGRSLAGTTPSDLQYLGWNNVLAQWEPKTLPSVGVPTVFGRTGAVTAQAGDYTAAQITNAVDQSVNYSNPAWIASLAWSKLSGAPLSFNAGQLQGRNISNTTPNDLQYMGWNNVLAQWEPKTLPSGGISAVFGRMGAVTAQAGDYTAAQITNAVDQTANYANPSWITSLAWSKLSGTPTSFNAGQLQGRSVASSTPSDLQYLGWNNGLEQWEPKMLPSPSISMVFGRTGAITAQTGDYTAAQVTNAVSQTGSYANPSWITSLAWNKLSGTPTSFNAGQLQGRNLASTQPNDLQYLGWNTAAGQWEPKTLAASVVSTVFGRTGAITAQAGDYTAAQVSNAVDQTASYSNPVWITSLAWSKLSGIPPSFNAGQLQGKSLSATAPIDLQYLGWNNSAGQWEPKTLPSATVATVFGRSGTVAAQTGDYTAAQVTNAVDQTGNYSNPSWITSLAWSKLSGAPLSFNAGQLQGRGLSATAPNDLQYLGWNNSAGQWEPKTLPAQNVSTVFGRSGAITAQTGDYTTAQVAESGNLYFTPARAQAAFSFLGVVRMTSGSVDCPTCITATTMADTDLGGTFPHLTVTRIQGRPIGTNTPSDLQYLGWNNAIGQWEPKTLPSPSVSTVFGRSGSIVAQTGDYSAAQVTNALDQTASYSNPSWITSLAWGKLTGIPLNFNAGQLQGRTVAGTSPSDLQYLGWNNSAGQWEPKNLPPAAVSSVFGRSGGITSQTGDYTFAQISGTASASQLPSVTMRTDQSNTISAGTQDFSGAVHTLPMKTGTTANLPNTCSPGETYFATDAPAGNNLYGCTTLNTWKSQGASPYAISSDGVAIGNRSTLNFVTGTGLMNTVTDTGSQINVQIGLDTALTQTQTGEQSGTALLCASASGSQRIYQCAMSPTLSSYRAGMVLHWEPDVNGLGGPTTLNIDQLGATTVTLSDGVTNPGQSDIVAGRMYELWYDGHIFRLVAAGGSSQGGSGAVASVFGRAGVITAQAGDYSANQITGLASVATSGSYSDLINKPAIPPAQVNADWNASGGMAQILNRPALATVASSGSYTDLSNRPSIPTVTITGSLLKGDGAGNAVAATVGADYMTSATAVLAAQLPAPGPTTLGGVQAKDCSGTGHVQKIGTDGTVTCSPDTGAGGTGTIASTASVLKGDGVGNAIGAIAGTDFAAPSIATTFTARQTFSGNASLGRGYLSITKTAGVTGVSANQVVKVDSTGGVVGASAGDAGVLGIAVSGAANGAEVEVATHGVISCVADNPTTVGDLAIVGTATAGRCRDSSQSNSTAIGSTTQILGRILTTVAAGQLASIELHGPEQYGTLQPAGQLAANIRARAIGYVFDGGGSALNTGTTKYLTVPFACTVSGWNLTVDTGTATVDIWKAATGTAIPTIANTITASATPAISAGTALHSTNLTAWTTAVAANDIFGFNLKTVSGATTVSLVLECDQ